MLGWSRQQYLHTNKRRTENLDLLRANASEHIETMDAPMDARSTLARLLSNRISKDDSAGTEIRFNIHDELAERGPRLTISAHCAESFRMALP